MEDNQYSNPVLEHYECNGQMDIFDFLDFVNESEPLKSDAKSDKKELEKSID